MLDAGVYATLDDLARAKGRERDLRLGQGVARAFRWRKLQDTSIHATLDDLARAKGVNVTYVLVKAWRGRSGGGSCWTPAFTRRWRTWRGPRASSRVLRLTLLAPEIVEAIVDGRQPEEMRSWMICWVSLRRGRLTERGWRG